MNIISYSREQIQEGLAHARSNHDAANGDIRLIFVPNRINHDNFDHACDIYSRIGSSKYDTVVIVESFGKVLNEKLLMPSQKYFETPLGDVQSNGSLRNEFCDAGDDFVIDDGGFSKDMSLFQQLMFLQPLCDDVSVLSVQIADERPAVVEELASVLNDVLPSRNTLVVCCCNLDNARSSEFAKVKQMVRYENRSGLMNYMSSGKSKIEGTSSFISGFLVANAWNMNLNFLNREYGNYKGSLLTAYAERQKVLYDE